MVGLICIRLANITIPPPVRLHSEVSNYTTSFKVIQSNYETWKFAYDLHAAQNTSRASDSGIREDEARIMKELWDFSQENAMEGVFRKQIII